MNETMDEFLLDDLLECTVCLERLDTSSKVLPCQHTFCKKCLEVIKKHHGELRCPECRMLIDTKIDDLPPNVLLMRILEGIRKVPEPDAARKLNNICKPPLRKHQLPCARAIYDFIASDPNDLSFEKGDIIFLKEIIDCNWYRGEINGKFGSFPISYVQIISPLPPQIPQCKALFNFKMENDEEEGCLSLVKGDIVTFMRNVDDNWAEGKLGDHIGIFPKAFVEENYVARKLMFPNRQSQARPVPAPVESSHGNCSTSMAQTDTLAKPSTSGVPSTSSNAGTLVAGTSKRHSLGSTLKSDPSGKYKRHSAEIIYPPENSFQSLPENSQNEPALVPHDFRNPLNLPAVYVAMYPYKPQKADELELKRGMSYTVTGRCQDGWFKGTNIRTQKSGVFPGNYVAPARSAMLRLQLQHSSTFAPHQLLNGMPPLEPRGPSQEMLVTSKCFSNEESIRHPVTPIPEPPNLSTTVVPPPNVSVHPVITRPAEKIREKKEKVGLMRRLTSMKKSKSPPLTPYSMDNPVFEDAAALPLQNIHIRSGSCPNQLLSSTNVEPSNSHRIFYSSSRSKTKERSGAPKVSPRNLPEQSTSLLPHHRKSNSLDTKSYSTYEHCSPKFSISQMQRLNLNDAVASNNSHHCTDQSLGSSEIKTSSITNIDGDKPTGHHKPREPSPLRNDPPTPILRIEDVKNGDVKNPKVYELLSQVMSNPVSYAVSTNQKSSDGTMCQFKRRPCESSKSTITKPRERFICIVPYPPNSEFELELQLGDVIYVHKKREDGWYKGTQQRTGRTGLFPASFVQSF